jgi:hypothetical protein
MRNLAKYYLDFETTGFDPTNKKIITIQYQKLEEETGKPLGRLEILKEWELSEKEILNRFLDIFGHNVNPWNFIPVGFNLRFEFLFLITRVKEVLGVNLPIKWLFYDKPYLDIKSTIVMINNGNFKGSKLSWFTNKKDHGHKIPVWYEQKQYQEIENYIKEETNEFIEAYQFLLRELPFFYEKFKQESY